MTERIFGVVRYTSTLTIGLPYLHTAKNPQVYCELRYYLSLHRAQRA